MWRNFRFLYMTYVEKEEIVHMWKKVFLHMTDLEQFEFYPILLQNQFGYNLRILWLSHFFSRNLCNACFSADEFSQKLCAEKNLQISGMQDLSLF